MGNESELWNKILSRAIALLYCNHDMLDIGIKESPLKVLH